MISTDRLANRDWQPTGLLPKKHYRHDNSDRDHPLLRSGWRQFRPM